MSDSSFGSPMRQPARLHFDFVDMKLFVKVAEARSVTRGAADTNISVAAASMRIKSLERALGAQLFNRTKRGMNLTQAGRVFEQHARNVLQQIDRLYDDLQVYSHEMAGHIRMLANPIAVSEFLPAALGEFLAAHPPITVDLREAISSHEIVRAVRDGTTDIGIVSKGVATEDLETIPYCADRMVLAVVIGHPLTSRAPVHFADALQFDFVSLDAHTANQLFLQQQAAELGRSAKIRAQVGNFDAMCRLIEANIGIGLLPQSVGRRYARFTALEIVDLADPWALRETKICARRFAALPGSARSLVEFLLEHPHAKQAMKKPGNVTIASKGERSRGRAPGPGNKGRQRERRPRR
jgi:DNA-binding transcriptional LysR family regulator